jgi:hypothetical protein
VATVDTDKQLAWEARQRPRAGIAAIVAALLTLGADLWTSGMLRDAPTSGYLEALRNAAEPGPVGSAESLRTPYYRFYEEHASSFVLANTVKAVGYVGVAWVLTFLIAAVRSRRPEVPRPMMYVALVGGVLSAIAAVAFALAYDSAVGRFLSGPHTVDRSAAAGTGTLLVTSQFVGLAGQFALAAGYVFVALNAMRTGLLTRFMGILGVIIGVLVVIPLGPLPVVQFFWLVTLGVLLLGFWPAGLPPAWRSGRSEPWPSQAGAAQRRRDATAARRGRAAPPERSEPAAVAADRSKRKRKRRS